MNRIIIQRSNPLFDRICEPYETYPYMANKDEYACIDVDSETLCVFKLMYIIWFHVDSMGRQYYTDKPTYVLGLFK